MPNTFGEKASSNQIKETSREDKEILELCGIRTPKPEVSYLDHKGALGYSLVYQETNKGANEQTGRNGQGNRRW